MFHEMHLDNFREAVQIAKEEGIVSYPLAQMMLLATKGKKTYLYERLIKALEQLKRSHDAILMHMLGM